MQRITLLCIGTPKFSWAKEACSQYMERLQTGCKFELVELPASKQKDSQKQMQEESEALLSKLEKLDGTVWVLDERGKQCTSQAFAGSLEGLKDSGQSVTFVLGGAYGLSDAVRDSADHLFALSSMTLPHDLARIFFLEQLYRAQQILKGTEYHH